MANVIESDDAVDEAVAEGGAYELIRQRLVQQGDALEEKTNALNAARAKEFGSTEMAVEARTRVRTENNSVGRDIVQVGELLLFGYNVFIGLKKTTQIEDVFSLSRIRVDGDQHVVEPVALEGSFLNDAGFKRDFDELYQYYRDARLVQLITRNETLLASFQIGDRLRDLRVFRWSMSGDGGKISYVDNRGERDIVPPETYDFEWVAAERKDIVHGRHPHINVLDQVFIETLNGRLTIKIENNTEDGEGAYQEPVEDKTQSLDDARFEYARVGGLILLKVLPYKEDAWRYLVFNPITGAVTRVDSIGDSCVQLPEDHGIIFPEGYYLETGEAKAFDLESSGFRFKRKIRSPNGEDMLYCFYEPEKGMVALLAYNLISKSLQNPIVSHGYAIADDGAMVVFSADDEPTRVHPMQIWRTPFVHYEYAAKVPVSQSFYSRIGNPELVRGISDLYTLCRSVAVDKASSKHYDAMRRSVDRLFDSHFWIADDETAGLGDIVREIGETIELIVDEFEKVESIREQSGAAMRAAVDEQRKVVLGADSVSWRSVDDYVGSLNAIRKHRGHLATIREYRYMDVDAVDVMDAELVELGDSVSQKTAEFLSSDDALDSYCEQISALAVSIPTRSTVATLDPDVELLDDVSNGLHVLSELIATLDVDDATVRTRIIQSISDVYSDLNQTRSRARQHRDSLGCEEAALQFAAQFKLFSQSVTNALALATTPERCEEQLTRLLIQLEEMEGQFSDNDRYFSEIAQKREEIYNTFETHKQQLLDARHARAQNLSDAALRMLDNIDKRTKRFNNDDELNTYLASDALVLKVRDIVDELRGLDNAVKADDAEARLKMIRDQAQRMLRDKTDLYSEGGKRIKLGSQHEFSVHTEDLDLTIIPRDNALALHLVGTQFFDPIDHAELNACRDYWQLNLESESPQVYRGEFLAYSIVQAARNATDNIDWPTLLDAVENEDDAISLAREFASPRYREAYQRGVHDVDAAKLLCVLVPRMELGELLRFDPKSRGLAQLMWSHLECSSDVDGETTDALIDRARSAARMHSLYNDFRAINLIERELHGLFEAFLETNKMSVDRSDVKRAIEYLATELGRASTQFVASREATGLAKRFLDSLDPGLKKDFATSLQSLSRRPAEQWDTARAWLAAYVENGADETLMHYVPEAAAQVITSDLLSHRVLDIDVHADVQGLFGEHPRIINGALSVILDEFLTRLQHHNDIVLPGYQRYMELRQRITLEARERLRLEEFKPKPLSSFVRNQLINDAYLPIIGDNLAKQIGTVGESKRSDLNGLLMMISPPGYGKTTLMEYVASRLGLTFMKINCPVLGHDVASLDPQMAPNATARQEIEKLNLALEMGDNVMLYLDDIQHTGAEFLQKFISLCDSTRRIEGVWKGKTHAYDLRGRKFCVVMAGNPYTESGETFKVPDMLANRADIYNLGDVLSGKEKQFELSYIENCLTSNPVLAPLGSRDQSDVYTLIDGARGRNVGTTDLNHPYSGAEIAEMIRVLEKLLLLQQTVLKVNQQYINSAAQDDRYRVEPRFLLQGSYRNMNKLAEKVTGVMNDKELNELIDDHYRGEAQLLTQGSEANLLKLAELRGTLETESADRWEQIKKDFMRDKALGGKDADAGMRISAQLADLVDGMNQLGSLRNQGGEDEKLLRHNTRASLMIGRSVDKLSKVVQQQKSVSIVNTPSDEFSQILTLLNETIQHTLFPLVRNMDRRIALELGSHQKLQKLEEELEELKKNVLRS